MNTKVSHTPGPWKVVDGMTSTFIKGGELYICDLERLGWDDFIVDANARLIAAAPSLLEALEIVQRLRHLIEYPNDDIPMGHLNQAASLMIMLEKVDEAIKLAKGEL